MASKKYSFRKGFDKVPGGDQPVVKARIMSVLDITTLPAWLARLDGDVEPKVSEKEKIEKVFQKYHITDIWGPGKSKKVLKKAQA